jgi:esterase/lipase
MEFLKKLIYFLLAMAILLAMVYMLGPRPDYPDMDFKIAPLDIPLQDLDTFVTKREAGLKNLKPNNESKIIWADSSQQKTDYAVVYLHGYSASPMEGDPIIFDFAEKYGMNLYTPLLAQHGIEDKESFKTLTPKMLIDDAKEAIAIGKLLGEKVILMSCSTGGTLSIPLIAENPDMVDAIVMFSPNFALYDDRAKLLSGPWGLQLGQKIQGSNYRKNELPPSCAGYWTMEYRIEGLIALQSLIDATMKAEYFKKIDSPILASFYYENEENQDKTISVQAIKDYLDLISTPKDQVMIEALPTTKSHIMISSLQSEDLAIVENKLDEFVKTILKIDAVNE